MRVSDLAQILEVTPDTVRFYTRKGFITPTKNQFNGYKIYNAKDKERLGFIISARQLGFSVDEIAQILGEADQGHTVCSLVRELIAQKLIETERQFQQTLALRNRLQAAITDWQSKPDIAPTGHMVCHLIEGIIEGVNENEKY